MVIYEEIINVIKSIYFIFLQKQNAKLDRKDRVLKGLKADMQLQEALQKQIDLEMQIDAENEDITEGYTIESSLII